MGKRNLLKKYHVEDRNNIKALDFIYFFEENYIATNYCIDTMNLFRTMNDEISNIID